jgi:hypothetical protein
MLYLRRGEPTGAHTLPIIQMLRLRRQHAGKIPAGPTGGLDLLVAPRLLGRRLLSEPDPFRKKLWDPVALGTQPMDLQIAAFVNDACDLLDQLAAAEHDISLNRPSECHSTAKRLRGLLADVDSWLDCVPSASRLSESATHLVQHELLQLGVKQRRLLTSGRNWITRDWVLYHMCRVKVLSALSRHSQQYQRDLCHRTRSDAPQYNKLDIDGINESCESLLGIVPGLIWRTYHGTTSERLELNDIGLLISQYPLLLVKDCEYVSALTNTEARTLLEFVDKARGIGR